MKLPRLIAGLERKAVALRCLPAVKWTGHAAGVAMAGGTLELVRASIRFAIRELRICQPKPQRPACRLPLRVIPGGAA